MKEKYFKLIKWLKEVVALLMKQIEILEENPAPVNNTGVTMSEILFKKAERSLGIDVTPLDRVNDELACVTSVTAILNHVVKFPRMSYTPYFVRELKRDKRFKGVMDIKVGDIMVNATGTGNGTIRGHCGIVGENGKIMSNDSYSGIWKYYYTIDSWKARYRVGGGMPTLVFRLLD